MQPLTLSDSEMKFPGINHLSTMPNTKQDTMPKKNGGIAIRI